MYCSGAMDRLLCCCVRGPNRDPTRTGTLWDLPSREGHERIEIPRNTRQNSWNHPETDEITWNHPKIQTQTGIADDSGWFLVDPQVCLKTHYSRGLFSEETGTKKDEFWSSIYRGLVNTHTEGPTSAFWEPMRFSDGTIAQLRALGYSMVKGTSRKLSVCRNNFPRHFKG